MSLMRQIGLLLAAVILLATAGAVGVNLVSARDTLQAQLRVKNNDNAQSLALALSQQRGQAPLMELLMAAQFDTGFYRRIRLTRGDGSLAFERQAEALAQRAPGWFVAQWPIDAPAGVAQVSDGWRALGRVEVVSQVAYAHDELWRGSVRAAGLLGAIGAAALLVAGVGVRRIRRPLDDTVAQARALEGGRYLIVDEPQVPELQRVARAMNTMVRRVKSLFEAQAAQVEGLRRQAHEDPLTGLPHRGHFMQRLDVMLHGEHGEHAERGGVLVLVRLADMAGLNRLLGRETTDRALRALGAVLGAWPVEGALAGRLNGADFALAMPVAGSPADAADIAAQLAERLHVALAPFGSTLAVHLGAVDWQRSAAPGALLAQADLALARAESGMPFTAQVAAGTHGAPAGEHSWHQQLSLAMAQQRTHLVSYPVVMRDGATWQLECPLRVQRTPGGEFESAAQWLPLAARSRLLPQLDLHAVALALAAIAVDGQPRGINLALASLADGAFTTQLRRLLGDAPRAAALLGLEVGEAAAIEQFALLQAFAAMVRPLGVRFGLEHAGHRLQRVERLYELGLDYVKLDAALVRGVAGDEAARRFVAGSVTMLHALAATVCAEGVDDAADAAALWTCGVDAITGPWASARYPYPARQRPAE